MVGSTDLVGLKHGDLLAGKYRIDKILGAGGMGVVVAAQHIHLDEWVAIKMLLPDMLGNGEAVTRFAREARAAVKIKSEHVARVTDVGTLENGAPYMVMEYLQGDDLSGWLKRWGPLPIEQAVEFVLQACEAIAEAHALGIVHRDLKPSNLFVIRRPDGALSVKVLDFGISKMKGGSSSVSDVSITKTSAMMGSPLYMSPEQMHSSKDVDSRSDIWALGIILYELISGDSPFLADTMQEVVARIVSSPPPPLTTRRPDAPSGLEAVILRCIDKDRTKRFATVGELATALMPFAPPRSRLSVERISGILRSAGLAGAVPAEPTSPEQPAAAGTQSAWGKTSTTGNRTTLTLAVGATLIVLSVGAFFLLRSSADDAGPEPPPPVAAQPAPPAPEEAAVRAPSAAVVAPPTAAMPALPATAVAPPVSSPAAPARKASRSKPAPVAAAPPIARSSATSAAKASAPPKSAGAFDDRK